MLCGKFVSGRIEIRKKLPNTHPTWFETDLTTKKRFSHSKKDFVPMFTNLFCKICFFRQMKLKIRNIFVRTFWRHESWSDQKRSWSVTLLLCTISAMGWDSNPASPAYCTFLYIKMRAFPEVVLLWFNFYNFCLVLVNLMLK